MNNLHRVILATYLTLTLLILLFHSLFGIEATSQYLKFGVRLAMFLTAAVLLRRSSVQNLIVLAFLSTLISDFFFVFLRAVDPDWPNRELYGMVGFIAAYLLLIGAFQRNFRIAKKELVAAVPFVIIFGLVLGSLQQYAMGFYFVAAMVLGAVLCYTGMTMVSTLYRGYFSSRAGWIIAVSGCILFISDMVVAFSIFHPDFKEFLLWKENLIWGTYMIGWTMLLIVTAEDEIKVNTRKYD